MIYGFLNQIGSLFSYGFLRNLGSLLPNGLLFYIGALWPDVFNSRIRFTESYWVNQ